MYGPAIYMHLTAAPVTPSTLTLTPITVDLADPGCNEASTCGWEDLPCTTLTYARDITPSANTFRLGDGNHPVETKQVRLEG